MTPEEKKFLGQALKVTIETGCEVCSFTIPRYQSPIMGLEELLNDQHHQNTMLKWCRGQFSIPTNYRRNIEETSSSSMAVMGRPTIFDKEKAQTIIDVVRAGNYLETAAAFSGVSVSTVRDWIRQGARGISKELSDFSAAIIKAEAETEIRDLQTIGEASKTNGKPPHGEGNEGPHNDGEGETRLR